MNKKVMIFGILLIIWMGIIFFMSNQNGDESGKTSSDIVMFIIDKYDKLTNASSDTIEYHHSEEFMNKANFIFRKICHFSEYLVLCILFFNFVIAVNKFTILLCNLYSIIFSLFYASLDEYHQTFVTGRGGIASDVLIDTFGAIIGLVLINLVHTIIKRRKITSKIVTNVKKTS